MAGSDGPSAILSLAPAVSLIGITAAMSDKRQLIRDAFLKAVFSLLGYIAHCDAQINRQEIFHLKIHLQKMRLSEEEQRQALDLFKAGTQSNFDAGQVIKEFRQSTTPKLIQILIVHLISMARADGGLVEKELHAIQWLARELGYKSIVLSQLLKMIYSQDQHAQRNKLNIEDPQSVYKTNNKASNQHAGSNKPYTNTQSFHNQDLSNAYKILGVNASMTEEEIRRAYKKLASQYHPDKLAGQNLTQEQLTAAAEKFKQVLAAYKYLKQHRFMYDTQKAST